MWVLIYLYFVLSSSPLVCFVFFLFVLVFLFDPFFLFFSFIVVVVAVVFSDVLLLKRKPKKITHP